MTRECPNCGGELLLYQDFGWRCSRDPRHDVIPGPMREIFLHVTPITGVYRSIPYRGVRFFERHPGSTRIVYIDRTSITVQETIDQLEKQVLEA